MEKNKHSRRPPGDGPGSLIDLLKQEGQGRLFAREESCLEMEDPSDELSVFDTNRLLRLLRAAIESDQWPFLR
ncbi:MAG TPA: hypothetical protein VLU25_21240 [Acidobacteriota bacterium]|nr:hypothetical protein [Acidobacteriota bacterium]